MGTLKSDSHALSCIVHEIATLLVLHIETCCYWGYRKNHMAANVTSYVAKWIYILRSIYITGPLGFWTRTILLTIMIDKICS